MIICASPDKVRDRERKIDDNRQLQNQIETKILRVTPIYGCFMKFTVIIYMIDDLIMMLENSMYQYIYITIEMSINCTQLYANHLDMLEI